MILVSGATGFLGTHLLIELCGRGEHIRAIKRATSDMAFVQRVFEFYGKALEFQQIEWVLADVMDIDSLMSVMEGVDGVYHCAAKVSFSEQDKKEMQQANIRGTANIVDVALECGIRKICHVSSIAVLGKAELITDETVWDENAQHSDYARSKYNAELEIWRGCAEGMDAVVVRPSVIVGPWKPQSGIGGLFQQIGGGLKYYTGGANSFVDVRDVARAMVLLMQSDIKNDGYLLTSQNLPYKEITTMIAEIIGKPAPHKFASRSTTEMAWRLNALKGFFTGKKSSFTKDTARISQNTSAYSNKKLKDQIPFEYRTVRKSLEDCHRFYMFLSK